MPSLYLLQHLLDLGRLAQARDHLHVEGRVGEALAEAAEVLLGQDRRRDQHHHLLAVDGSLVGRPQRDLRLAVADVAADEAVHRALALHVGLDRIDRLHLVGGLAVGKRGLEGELQLAVGREGVAAAHASLGVEVEQLAGHLLRGPPRPRLQVEPALAPERAQLRLGAVGADVAADLGELVGGGEDAVAAPVLQLEVVASDLGQRLRVEAREARNAVVLVDHQVPHSQLDRARDPVPRLGRGSGLAAAVHEPRVGDHRELQLRGDETLPQARLGEVHPRLRRGLAHQGRGVDAGEVVAHALGLARALEGDHGPVAGAHQLLQLRLGLGGRARGELGALGTIGQLLVRVRAAQRQRRPALQVVGNVHVEPSGVVRVHGGCDVLPVVLERPGDLLGLGDRNEGLLRHQVERRAKAVQGDQLCQVGALLGLRLRRVRSEVRELAVLGSQLGRRGQLHPLCVAERALGEGREPPHGLDLVAKELHPDRPLLGRGVGVEDVPSDGELASLLDLLDPLVAGLAQQRRDVGEVNGLAHVQRQTVGPQLGVRHRLGQRHGAGDDDRAGSPRRAPRSRPPAARRGEAEGRRARGSPCRARDRDAPGGAPGKPPGQPPCPGPSDHRR